MRVFLDLEDSISRFRFAQSCVGLAGSLCVCYAVGTPFWLKDQGLWTKPSTTLSDPTNLIPDTFFNGVDSCALGRCAKISCTCTCPATVDCIPFLCVKGTLEAEQVFGIISSLLALSTGALCLVFALCWTSRTVRSYTNTRSLLMAGQALYPTTLLLLTMVSTGFFFLLSWSFFTHQHWEEICQDVSKLGSSFWFGALGWVLLLLVEGVVFVAEQVTVPDILPDLEKAVESWRISNQLRRLKRSYSGE